MTTERLYLRQNEAKTSVLCLRNLPPALFENQTAPHPPQKAVLQIREEQPNTNTPLLHAERRPLSLQFLLQD